MEENDFARACSEVILIIKNSSEEVKNKIPNQFINFLQENENKDFVANIDFNKENLEEQLSKDAIAILGLIYRDYLVSSEERQMILYEEEQERLRYEKELREKYNPDNIFKKKNNNILEKDGDIQLNQIQLVEVKKSSWLKRLLSKILSFFGK